MIPQSSGNLGAGAALSARESAPTSAQRRPALNDRRSAPARGDFCPALICIDWAGAHCGAHDESQADAHGLP